MIRTTSLLAATLAVTLLAGTSFGADGLTSSLKKGTPALKAVGPLAFGPEGILFVADPSTVTIYAIATGDTTPGGKGDIKIEKIDDQIAGMLGTMAADITINDMKVNPASGNLYFSVSRGKGPAASPVIVKFDRAGKLSPFELKDVAFSSITIPNASEKQRTESVTSLAYVKDRVIVAGLSNEEFASKLRSIPFPFKDPAKGASIEIFHGAHGKLETQAPVRTFTIYDIHGQTHILAAYTCTPLVKIPISDLKEGSKVKGTTVAELGNRNRPLDMITYKKGGKDFVLMANSARGVMKINTEGIDKIEAINKPVEGTAGLKYDTVKELEGVMQLDKLDEERVVLLVKVGTGFKLETVPMP